MRLVVVLALAVLSAACGKRDVRDLDETPWEPATLENGFHAVLPPLCTAAPRGHRPEPTPPVSVREDIITKRPVDHVATDASGVYWAEDRVIHRAATADPPSASRWPDHWVDGAVATSETRVLDLAVTDGRIYWVSGDADRRILSYVEKRDPARVVHGFSEIVTVPMSKLVARGTSLFYALHDASYEVEDGGAVWTLPAGGASTVPVIAVDDHAVYTYSRWSGLTRMPRRQPWQMPRTIASAMDPTDLVTDGTVVYWLERGERSDGRLRRAPVSGGTAEDVYGDIRYASGLTMNGGEVWISTREGLVRYDPTCYHAPAVLAGTAELRGRPAPFGDALAVAKWSEEQPRVGLVRSE
ncbi:MAG: hypothetical protein U0270_39680 [Labilithrix sp.]